MVAESAQDSPSKDIYGKWLPLRYEHGFDYAMLWQVLAVYGTLWRLVFWNWEADEENEGLQASRQRQQQTNELATLDARVDQSTPR